ncbi:ferric reductase-like transmembrane domain-containing protein [[Clostridium] colinum]|uniref:ferric reductase-like transmembrane domain-containing protein n=1 Tax=[Clostridium] colinum TaxID=36835 RepID=UPI002024F4DB|nr:ferric reductase-like transmembrane domain-containing protein [[Clostridium] colinum]
MYPVLSLVLALLFVLGLGNQIKKYPKFFYSLSVILVIAIGIYYQFKLKEVFPEWFTHYIVNPFKRGAFSTALFIIVMYTGILNSKWAITKKLYKIRGEISIIACIITLSHNFVYGFTGKKHFITLFTHPQDMKLKYFIAAIISVIMICMMLPLMITSFQNVRKKMKYHTWKNIQRMAYPFFALIYIHTMVLFGTKASEKTLEIALYSVIFIGYGILRVAKALRSKSTVNVNNKKIYYAS